MKRIVVFVSLILFLIGIFSFFDIKSVRADELTDNIDEQMQNINLEELEEYYDSLNKNTSLTFTDFVYKLLKGEYDFSYNTILEYVVDVFFNGVKDLIPIFISIIAIAIFCSILQNLRSNLLSEGTYNLIFLVCLISITLLIAYQIIDIFSNAINTINNLSKLSEIMSPIIIGLMVASGGKVSASVYSPAVSFLSNGIINVVVSIVLPLVVAITILNLVGNMSSTIKLNRFSEFISTVIKYVLGVSMTVFGLFLTVQGLTSATFDGISIKAAKYAISNSIPIVGGFLRDGFDLVVAGSILIKSSVGFGVIVSIFYTILSPILFMATFSLLLRLSGSIVGLVSDTRISDFCFQTAKSISYLIACVCLVAFMFFICVLLMIFSANAFI